MSGLYYAGRGVLARAPSTAHPWDCLCSDCAQRELLARALREGGEGAGLERSEDGARTDTDGGER